MTGHVKWLSLALLCALVVLPGAASGALNTAYSGTASWSWVSPGPQGNTIHDIDFASSTEGFAVGDSGVVLRTTNAGVSWTSKNSNPPLGTLWYGVAAPTTSDVWVVGSQGRVRKTADSGATWVTQNTATSATLRDVDALSASAAVTVGDAAGGSSTIYYTANGGTSWTQGSVPSATNLTSVSLASPSLAWAVGAAGTMLYSNDGGASWGSITPLTDQGLNGVVMAPGTTTGYAVGNANGTSWTAFKTTNGTSWTALTLPGTAVNLLGVTCSPNGSVVTVSGAGGVVYHSTDGGTSWTLRSPATLTWATFYAIATPTTGQLVTGGSKGALVRSRNSGQTWLSENQYSPENIKDTWFVSATLGYAITPDGKILKTTNGGTTWNGRRIAGLPSGTVLSAVSFADASNGWVVANIGRVYRTADGGATWAAQTSNTTANLHDVSFVAGLTPLTGYACGDGGTIIRTVDGGTTWTTLNSGTTQTLLSLSTFTASQIDVCGTNGTILRATNGTNFNTRNSGTTATLRGIWASSVSRVVAVGDGGTVLYTTNGSAWTLGTSGTTENLYGVHMPTTAIAWAVGANGTVIRTTNGGISYTAQSTAAGFPAAAPDGNVRVNSVFAPAADLGASAFAVGEQGHIRWTTDSGTTWLPHYHSDPRNIRDLTATTEQMNWAVGENGLVRHTFDGFVTSYKQDAGTTQDLFGIDIIDAGGHVGWLVGANGTIRRTVDGGWNWTAQTSGTTAQLNDVEAASSSAGLAVGAAGTIVRTTDSGTTWSAVTPAPTTQILYGVDAVGTSAWAVGAGGTILRSTDSGANWSPQTSGTSQTLYDIEMRSANLGIAVGAGGTILKTTNGGSTWTLIQDPDAVLDLFDAYFESNTVATAVGRNGTVLRTADAGDTWSPENAGTTVHDLYANVQMSPSSAWLAGQDGAIFGYNDTTAPVTTLITDPITPNGLDSWFTVTPMIRLVPNEAATSKYRLNSTGAWIDYTAPFPGIEGTNTVQFYSVDAAGNTEDPAKVSDDIKVDITTPTAPPSVQVSEVGTSTAVITWDAGSDAVSGVSYYTIYIDGVARGTSMTPSEFTVQGLAPNTNYQAQVTTHDRAGLMSDYAAQNFTTADDDTSPLNTVPSLMPMAPNGANGWYTSSPMVTFTTLPLSATPTPTVYYQYTAPQLSAPTTPSAGWVSAGLSPATIDDYPVSEGARDLWFYSDNVSLRADEQPKRLQLKVDVSPPSAPGARVDTLTVGYSTVTLTWQDAESVDAQSDIDYYNIYSGSNLIGQAADTDTSFEVLALQPSTAYTFYVEAVNMAGLTAKSAAIEVTTNVPPLTAPNVVYARAITGEAIFVNWEPSAEASAVGQISYRVWRSTDGENYSLAPGGTLNGRLSTFYADTTVRSSTRYWYAVSARDDYNNPGTYYESQMRVASNGLRDVPMGAMSAQKLRKAEESEEPTGVILTLAPQRPVRPHAVAGNGTVHLSLGVAPIANAAFYNVYRSEASLGASELVTSVAAPATSYTDTGLENGTTYFYRVSIVDTGTPSGAESAKSVERDVTPMNVAGLPDSPHGEPGQVQRGCESCHVGHNASASSNRRRTCAQCHNGEDGSKVASETVEGVVVSVHEVDGSETDLDKLKCLTCHRGHQLPSLDASNTALLAVEPATGPTAVAGTAVCLACHGTGSTLDSGSMAAFEVSVHNESATGEVTSDVGIVCSNCHRQHSSPNPQLLRFRDHMQCVQCHAGEADADRPDILRLISRGEAGARHPLTRTDQQITGARLTCENCHNPHVVMDDAKVVDPENPSPQGVWQGSVNDLCLKCHDGVLPTASQVGRWAAAPLASGGSQITTNIAGLWNTNAHGYRSISATDLPRLSLRPDMGYANAGTVLDCIACHDQHGSPNGYSLKSSISSADGSKRVDGLLVAPVPGGGYDLRFFCNACHSLTTQGHAQAAATHDPPVDVDISQFPMNCLSSECHGHSGAHW